MASLEQKSGYLERLSSCAIGWIGSTASIISHSIFFAGIFALRLFGFGFSDVLIILTTIVSLEAIYLAIFIQMTVNRQAASLAEVDQDIEELKGDMAELGEDVAEISEDVTELNEDEIEDDERQKQFRESLAQIQNELQKVLGNIETLKQGKSPQP